MAGYTRQDVSNNIATGNVINASDLDGEFDAIDAAFDESTGHTHDGTTDEGGPITVVGPAQDILVDGTAIYPKTDDAYDVGKVGAEFKDGFFDGTLNADNLTVTGTITFTGATISDAGTVTTVDINGGTGDSFVIGGTTPAAGTFTDLTASGAVDLSGATVANFGITSTSPELFFIDSNGNAGNAQTRIGASSSSFAISTYNSSGTKVTDEYLIGRSTGAATTHIWYVNSTPTYEISPTSHTWSISGTDIVDIDSNGLNVDGRIVVSGSTDLLINDTAGTVTLAVDNSTTVANSELTVNIDNTERMSVSPTGVNAVGGLTRDGGGNVAWEFIEKKTASSSASLSFTGFDSTKYDTYIFVFEDIFPSVDGAALTLVTSDDGGSTYDSSAGNYFYTSATFNASQSYLHDQTSTNVPCTAALGTGIAEFGGSGQINIYGAHNPSYKTKFFVNSTGDGTSGDLFIAQLGAYRNATEDNDAVRFQMTSGNIAAGTITMYGLRNS